MNIYKLHIHSYLGTILPTSIDCERCFSTTPYVDYKIRSDDMLYAFPIYTYFGTQIIFLKLMYLYMYNLRFLVTFFYTYFFIFYFY